jgi:ketosteroid isomerase-like protein
VPDVVWRYYDAHDRRDTDAALSAFGADATVADDGHEYVGSGAIRHWLAEASTEFTYTRTVVGADAVGADTWVVTNHLEGNFPGNVVDLRYQFVVRGGRIVRLIIAP